MKLERHIEAHKQLFMHLVKGDGNSAHKHKEFYDEYLAVMDLAAEYYLQTVDTVFVRRAMPNGEMTHRGRPVDLAGSSASRCSRSKASTTTFPASARPRRRIGCASTSRPTARRTGCSLASATTACSTVRAFARDCAAHRAFHLVDGTPGEHARNGAAKRSAHNGGRAARLTSHRQRPSRAPPIWHYPHGFGPGTPAMPLHALLYRRPVSLRRSKSFSIARFFRFAYGGSVRRAVIRCAFKPPRAK